MKLVSLQFKTSNDFKANLSKLIGLINKTDTNSFILAPELCLTGYSYDELDNSCEVSLHAISVLKNLSFDKKIALTLSTKENGKYFNTLHIFHKNKIIYTQHKNKLFPLGNEDKYFTNGLSSDIKIITIDNFKIATLICFEIRFPYLWEQIKGADIILVPAMWGIKRKEHFESINKSLAIINQCFVISSNSSNEDMASGSAIITPFGDEIKDDNKEIIINDFDSSLISTMRKYIKVGL